MEKDLLNKKDNLNTEENINYLKGANDPLDLVNRINNKNNESPYRKDGTLRVLTEEYPQFLEDKRLKKLPQKYQALFLKGFVDHLNDLGWEDNLEDAVMSNPNYNDYMNYTPRQKQLLAYDSIVRSLDTEEGRKEAFNQIEEYLPNYDDKDNADLKELLDYLGVKDKEITGEKLFDELKALLNQ